jgi:hypothetical protein
MMGYTNDKIRQRFVIDVTKSLLLSWVSKLLLSDPVVTLFTIRFNIHKYEIMPTECISAIVIDLNIIGDYLPTQKNNFLFL